MQHTKTIDVPATTKTVVERITCDLCGDDIRDQGFEFDRVEIERRKGYHYPEGGMALVTTVDLCPACWEGQLLYWLEKRGVKPRVEEVDY